MISKLKSIVYVLMVFSFFIVTKEQIGASEQGSANVGLSNISVDKYKEMVADEERILDGLKNLLELRQKEDLHDKDTAVELIDKNENISIKRKNANYGIVLYSIKADLVSIDEILQALVSESGKKKIIIDEDIDKEELSSIISIDMDSAPFADIIDVVLGAKGFETIVSEGLVFVTLPVKLNMSSYGYYREKAIQAYQKAMIKYPDYKEIARAYYELGNFYLALDLPTIALQEYKTVVINYPDHPLAKESMFNEGKCFEMLDDLDNARECYLDYVQRNPQAPNVDDTYLIIGDLWEKQKNYDMAIEIYNYVITEYRDSDTAMHAQMRLGNTYLDAGDYSSALQVFLNMKKEYLTKDHQSKPSEHIAENISLEHQLKKGSSTFQKDRLGNNRLEPSRLILPDKLHYELEYQIGNCYSLLGQYRDAIKALSDFVFYEKSGDMLDKSYYKLADCFFESEDFLTAFQLYKSALAEYPNSKFSAHGLLYSGKSLRQMKMLDNAVEILNQGLSQHHDGVYAERIKLEIGLCYLDDENSKRAFDIFEGITGRKKNKDLVVKSFIYMGVCLMQDKQFEKAIESFKEAFNGEMTEKQRNWAFELTGNCYSELGLLEKAVKAYQQDI
ncbi:MAG: tetratricopeptide repeat protein [Candidatus Scalindua sp.]|nr:tetratricopeptide repeat protein [Candidatus Scalindua sp.]